MAMSTVRLSDELKEKTLETLPRAISISALVRWVLHAAVDSQAVFERAVNKDKEMMRVQEYMADRIEKLFAHK